MKDEPLEQNQSRDVTVNDSAPAETSAEPSTLDARREQNRKSCRTKTYIVWHALLAGPIRFFHRIRVRGRENEPRRGEGSYLVVCNHINWRDPIFLCAALTQQQPHFMAKKELFKTPVFRGLIRSLGAYPVNRSGLDMGAIRATVDMLSSGKSVGMFPQGHRNPGVDPRQTPVHAGCALVSTRADVPILPVFIKTPERKITFLCKKEIIIGTPITQEELGYVPGRPGEFDRISRIVFERVCALGDDKPTEESDK